MPDSIDVFATAYGEAPSRAIARSAAHLGYETSRGRPPDDLDVEFCDYNFRDGTPFYEHLQAVEREQPTLAVAPDVEDAADLDAAVDQADRLAEHAEQVVMVPKGVHPTEIPDRFRVGLPLANWDMPDNVDDLDGFYDTTGKPTFHPWTAYQDVGEVHLLGGGPMTQLEVSKFHIPVASVDGASPVKAAQKGGLFTPEKWLKVTAACPGLYEAMRHSLDNLVRAWSVRYNYNPPISADVYDASECADEIAEAKRQAREQVEQDRAYRDAGHGPAYIEADDEDLWGPQDYDDEVVPEVVDWEARMNEAEQKAAAAARRELEKVTDGGQPDLGAFTGGSSGEELGADASTEGKSEEPAMYDPTDDVDDERDSPKIRGFGDYREQGLKRLEETPHLSPIETFDSIDELVEAVADIHVAGYSNPPEKTMERLRSTYESLPSDEAKRYYLNDYKLVRTVNAARRAFNEWVGRKKRYDRIPSWAEAGPSNYPVRKHGKARDSERKGRETLDEKLDRLHGRVKGAERRALKKAGTSVGEQNELKREAMREEGRDKYEKGDLVVYKHYVQPWGVYGVKKVNKKSLSLSSPYEYGDDDKTHQTTNAKLDRPQALKGPIPPEEWEEMDERHGYPSDYREAQIELFGEKWVNRHLADDTYTSSDDTDMSDTDTSSDDLAEQFRDLGVNSRSANKLANDFFSVEDALNHDDAYLLNIEGIGEGTVETLREAQHGPKKDAADRAIEAGEEMKQTLTDMGVTAQAADILTGQYERVEDVEAASDTELLAIDGIGEGTVETLRQGEGKDDYKVTGSGEGWSQAEWYEDATPEEDWADTIWYLRDHYGDSYTARIEAVGRVMRWADENGHDLPQDFGGEGVWQPILRYQSIPPEDVLNQIENKVKDDEKVEQIREAIIAFFYAQPLGDEPEAVEEPEPEPEPEEVEVEEIPDPDEDKEAKKASPYQPDWGDYASDDGDLTEAGFMDALGDLADYWHGWDVTTRPGDFAGSDDRLVAKLSFSGEKIEGGLASNTTQYGWVTIKTNRSGGKLKWQADVKIGTSGSISNIHSGDSIKTGRALYDDRLVVGPRREVAEELVGFFNFGSHTNAESWFTPESEVEVEEPEPEGPSYGEEVEANKAALPDPPAGWVVNVVHDDEVYLDKTGEQYLKREGEDATARLFKRDGKWDAEYTIDDNTYDGLDRLEDDLTTAAHSLFDHLAERAEKKADRDAQTVESYSVEWPENLHGYDLRRDRGDERSAYYEIRYGSWNPQLGMDTRSDTFDIRWYDDTGWYHGPNYEGPSKQDAIEAAREVAKERTEKYARLDRKAERQQQERRQKQKERREAEAEAEREEIDLDAEREYLNEQVEDANFPDTVNGWQHETYDRYNERQIVWEAEATADDGGPGRLFTVITPRGPRRENWWVTEDWESFDKGSRSSPVSGPHESIDEAIEAAIDHMEANPRSTLEEESFDFYDDANDYVGEWFRIHEKFDLPGVGDEDVVEITGNDYSEEMGGSLYGYVLDTGETEEFDWETWKRVHADAGVSTIPDPGDYSISEIKKKVAEIEDAQTLRAMGFREAEDKDRKGAKKAINQQRLGLIDSRAYREEQREKRDEAAEKAAAGNYELTDALGTSYWFHPKDGYEGRAVRVKTKDVNNPERWAFVPPSEAFVPGFQDSFEKALGQATRWMKNHPAQPVEDDDEADDEQVNPFVDTRPQQATLGTEDATQYRESRVAEGSEAFADDRVYDPTSDVSKQASLFAEKVEGQASLTGEQAEVKPDWEIPKNRHNQPWGETKIRGKTLTNEHVGRIRHRAEQNDLMWGLSAAQIDLANDAIVQAVGDVDGLIDYYDEHGDFSDIDGVGKASNDRLVEVMPIIKEARGVEPDDEPDDDYPAGLVADGEDGKEVLLKLANIDGPTAERLIDEFGGAYAAADYASGTDVPGASRKRDRAGPNRLHGIEGVGRTAHYRLKGVSLMSEGNHPVYSRKTTRDWNQRERVDTPISSEYRLGARDGTSLLVTFDSDSGTWTTERDGEEIASGSKVEAVEAARAVMIGSDWDAETAASEALAAHEAKQDALYEVSNEDAFGPAFDGYTSEELARMSGVSASDWDDPYQHDERDVPDYVRDAEDAMFKAFAEKDAADQKIRDYLDLPETVNGYTLETVGESEIRYARDDGDEGSEVVRAQPISGVGVEVFRQQVNRRGTAEGTEDIGTFDKLMAAAEAMLAYIEDQPAEKSTKVSRLEGWVTNEMVLTLGLNDQKEFYGMSTGIHQKVLNHYLDPEDANLADLKAEIREAPDELGDIKGVGPDAEQKYLKWAGVEQPADSEAEQVEFDVADDASDTETLEVEFPSRDAANAARDDLPDGAETNQYDRRHKTVEVYVGALSDSEREQFEAATLDARRDKDVKYGQADLTDNEKRLLKKRDGWTWGTHGFHARSAKAILTQHGVDDWLSHYDHTIEAQEHHSVVPDRGNQPEELLGVGSRGGDVYEVDEDDPQAVERAGKAAAKAHSEDCSNAEKWCGKGDEGACVHLKSECGWDDDEIEEMRADVMEMEARMDALVTDDGGPIEEGEPAIEPEVAEVADTEQLPPFALRTLQRAWNGFRAAALEAEEGKEAVERYNEARREARQYGAMVNEVRARFGQDPIEIEATVTEEDEEGNDVTRKVRLADLPELEGVEWGSAGDTSPTAESEGVTLFASGFYDPVAEMRTDGGAVAMAPSSSGAAVPGEERIPESGVIETDGEPFHIGKEHAGRRPIDVAREEHAQRSPDAVEMDEDIQAREQVGGLEGLVMWLKAPNMMDYVGVDDVPEMMGLGNL